MDDSIWLKAAQAMAGRPVNIRFSEPPIKDFDGQAVVINGVPTVYIRDTLDDENKICVLAHGCGHIRLNTAPTVTPGQKPGSLKLTPLGIRLREIHPTTRENETGADRLASVFLDFAQKHASEYPGDWLESRLKALAGYISPEIQARVDLLAIKAAEIAVKNLNLKR